MCFILFEKGNYYRGGQPTLLLIFIVALDVSFNSHSNHYVRLLFDLKESTKSILSKFSEVIALFQLENMCFILFKKGNYYRGGQPTLLLLFIVALGVPFNSHSNHYVRLLFDLKELTKSILSKFSSVIALFQPN